MFALKKANVLYRHINTLKSVQWKLTSKNFATTAVNNQMNMKSPGYSAQLQISRQNHATTSFFPSMKPEIQKDRAEHIHAYPDFIRGLIEIDGFTFKPINIKEAEDHFIKMLDYVLSGGHRDFLKIMLKMYQDLMVNKEITTENMKQIHVLSCCLEMLLAAFLMVDDVYEDAEIRRNKPCWHKVEPKLAANDFLMLQIGCDRILNRFFGHLPCYSGIMHVVTDSFMVALLGHSLEIQLNKLSPKHFTIQRFNESSLMKTSPFRFYMPAATSMLLAGYDLNKDKHLFETVKLITHEIGIFYASMNDYLDCYSAEIHLFKPEADIALGKFSWPTTMAMEHGTEQQKDIILKYYGKSDADCVAKVKQVYNELCMPDLFNDYKDRTRNNVMHQIDQLLQSDEILRTACINFFSQAFE